MRPDLLVRRLADQHSRHKEERIKPQPNLFVHLDHVLGGEILAPIIAVLEILQSRKRHDPGVKPNVAHFRDPLHGRAAFLALNLDLVNPRPMQFLKIIDEARVDGFFAQLLLASDNGQVTAGAGIKRQRQTVETFPGNIPVRHIVKPVFHPLPLVRGIPFYFPGVFDQKRPQFVDGDRPFLAEAEKDFFFTAPADGVTMLIRVNQKEFSLLAQALENKLAYFLGVLAGKKAEIFVKVAVLVDRHDDRKVFL